MAKIENTELINTSNISTKYGVIMGAILSGLLLIFQIAGKDYSPFGKLTKFIVIFIMITWVLNMLKNRIKGDIFIKGLSVGTKMSMVAALLVIVINVILFAVAQDISFSRYGLEPTSFMDLAMISAILFFEIFVFGSLIAFIVLQYLKGKRVE